MVGGETASILSLFPFHYLCMAKIEGENKTYELGLGQYLAGQHYSRLSCGTSDYLEHFVIVIARLPIQKSSKINHNCTYLITAPWHQVFSHRDVADVWTASSTRGGCDH